MLASGDNIYSFSVIHCLDVENNTWVILGQLLAHGVLLCVSIDS